MQLYKSSLNFLCGLICISSMLNAVFDIKKTNKFTSYNCQTGNIILNIQGDENAVYIVSSCIFIAGATPGEKKMKTSGFRQIDVSQPQTVTLADLQKGLLYSPTQRPQNSYKIYLYATIDPIDQLADKIKTEYKARGITHAVQLWRAAEFKAGALANSSGTSSFSVLQTLPANLTQEDDTITLYANGDIVLDNAEGSITIPAQSIR